MSTIKADSRAGVRRVQLNRRNPVRFLVEALFEAQRVAVVVIIVVVPAEKAVARLLIARDRAGIVLVNFQSHRPATSALRRLLCRFKKKRSNPASANVWGNRDGIKASVLGARRIEHENVAGEFAGFFRNEKRGVW